MAAIPRAMVRDSSSGERNAIDPSKPGLRARAGLFPAAQSRRLDLRRRAGGRIAVRLRALRQLYGLLREGRAAAGRTDLRLAGLALEAGSPADAGDRRAFAGGHRHVWRRTGTGGQEILPQVHALQPVRDPVDECAVLPLYTVLLGRPGHHCRHRQRDRLAPVLGGRGAGLHRHDVFVLFCLITALFYLYYEERYATRQLGAFVLTVITAAVGFLMWYTVSRDAAEIQPLVPALQSWWMKIHVPANFIGYGTFALAAMVAVAYLLRERGILADRLPTLEVLDDVMYKAIAVGFAFFTIATILGALWAAEAWGGYWSWDPKETWALIVWLNYAAWLHMRLMKGLRGRTAAWWALVGLLVTTFAFLGVNMFLSGLHSYGEL
ncbi:hypothetical protein Lal_00007038 [Lupinus albus]|nr:hypothetical protein Lal_00007038 [Lupinus albus]